MPGANLCEESGSSNINEYHTAAVDQNCLNIRFTCFWEESLIVTIFIVNIMRVAMVFHSLPDLKKSFSEENEVLAMPLS